MCVTTFLFFCFSTRRSVFNNFSFTTNDFSIFPCHNTPCFRVSCVQKATPASCIIWLIYFVLGLSLDRVSILFLRLLNFITHPHASTRVLSSAISCSLECLSMFSSLLVFKTTSFVLLSTILHLFFSQSNIFFASISNTTFQVFLT